MVTIEKDKKQVINIYYYKNSNVHVTYKDKETDQEIAEAVTISGYEGKEYTTTQKEIENYIFVEDTKNTSGTMERETIEVTYYYLYNLTDVSITKVWNDNNNQDGLRNDYSVTLTGKDGGTILTTDTQTFTKDKTSYTWSNLTKYYNGTEITYTVEESKVPAGYTAEISGNAIDGFTITNSHTPETISVSGIKTWDDSDNQDGKRPSKITVNLYSNGKLVESKTVTESDGWTYSFENLPKYKDGVEIVYTIDETAVEGYTTTYNGYDITNSYTPETTEVSVTKIWDDNENQDGKRDNYSITITGIVEDEEVYTNTQELDKDTLEYTWENLAKYYNGTEITYTVDETNMPEGYTKEVTGNQETGFIITNSYTPETTEVRVTKVWDDNNNQDGKRDDYSITITGTVGDEEVYTNIQELDKDTLEYTWENLAKYYNGVEITYTVDETNMPEGYTKEITGDQETGFIITNSYTPETTEVRVTKVWDDNNNQDGKRANYSITIIGTVGDEEVYTNTQELDKDELEYTWKNLAKYYNGTEITYTVDETNMPESYTKEISGNQETGFTITNTYIPVEKEPESTPPESSPENTTKEPDNTVAIGEIPNTGGMIFTKIFLCFLSLVVIIAITLYIKFRTYDDIK